MTSYNFSCHCLSKLKYDLYICQIELIVYLKTFLKRKQNKLKLKHISHFDQEHQKCFLNAMQDVKVTKYFFATHVKYTRLHFVVIYLKSTSIFILFRDVIQLSYAFASAVCICSTGNNV